MRRFLASQAAADLATAASGALIAYGLYLAWALA